MCSLRPSPDPNTRGQEVPRAPRPCGAGAGTPVEQPSSAPSHSGSGPGQCRPAVHWGHWAIPTRHDGWRRLGPVGQAGQAGWVSQVSQVKQNKRDKKVGPGRPSQHRRETGTSRCAVLCRAGCAVHAPRVGLLGSAAWGNISAYDSEAGPMAVAGAFMREFWVEKGASTALSGSWRLGSPPEGRPGDHRVATF
jgi:hypothetical protein